MHSYTFGPFTLLTDLEMPELAASTRNSTMELVLTAGPVPPGISDPVYQDRYCSATADEFLLNIPGVARYSIRYGREITFEAQPGADTVDIRGFLLGNVFAIACHQRRLLPLHASAVLIDGGVVAFLAASGAGKSTLAAFMANNGCPLAADDICLLDPLAPPNARVLPVPPWLKLWPGSLTALGFEVDGLARTFTDEEKFKLPVSRFPTVPPEPLPLKALVILEPSGTEAAFRLTPLRPPQTIAGMMKFTYQSFLLDWLGLRNEHFANCAKSLGNATAYSFERAWGFDSLSTTAAEIQKFFTADPA